MKTAHQTVVASNNNQIETRRFAKEATPEFWKKFHKDCRERGITLKGQEKRA